MGFLEDPEQMTPEARMDELAAILAKGYLRLLTSSPPQADSPVLASASPNKGLDSSPATSGLLDVESTERREDQS